MPPTKQTDLAAILGSGLADNDEIVVVDKSDTSMDAAGTAKRIDKSELMDAARMKVTPVGGLGATTVQAALAELDSEAAAVPTLAAGADVTVTPGGGLVTVAVAATSSQKWGTADYEIAVADDTGTTSATQAADAALTGKVALVANAWYFFDAVIFYTALESAGKMKGSLRYPAGTTAGMSITGVDPTNASTTVPTPGKQMYSDAASQLFLFGGGGALIMQLVIRGWIKVGGTGGFVDWWYGQSTANATPTVRKAGSWMRVQRIV